jgi:hypothetical protein
MMVPSVAKDTRSARPPWPGFSVNPTYAVQRDGATPHLDSKHARIPLDEADPQPVDPKLIRQVDREELLARIGHDPKEASFEFDAGDSSRSHVVSRSSW